MNVLATRGAACALAMAMCLWAGTAAGDEKLAGIACRSVHLRFPGPESEAFYNEITVDQSAPGTYFMVCGWSRGYFGIQELANGKKLILFSVWDSQADDPNATPLEERVQEFEPAEGVRVKRFGNEGSGGQSFFDYDWKIGETYKFCVSTQVIGGRTAYSGWFFHPERQAWLRLMTFATPTPEPERLRSFYSFIEDFRRNRASAGQARVARFGNAWSLDGGEWKPLTRTQFTADSNPALTINAKVVDGLFLLATGGDTENTDVKLRGSMTLPEPPAAAPDWKPTPLESLGD
ncbi:MAG: DUF3472 domain-containing protein [Planctomyces sp.]|nr:DUF3472 domain-containing protein [Planctomyces sp.]